MKTGLNIILVIICAVLLVALVAKESPKEKVITKEIQVPAQIPEEYERAMTFYKLFANVGPMPENESLKGIKAVAVNIILNDDTKKIVDEQKIRTNIELNLRKSGIIVKENWPIVLNYSLQIMPDDQKGDQVFSYVISINCNVEEQGTILQNFREPMGVPVLVLNRVWQTGKLGILGTSKLDSLTKYATECVDEFVNKWLESNPKQ